MGRQERLKRLYTSTRLLGSHFTVQQSSRQYEANLYLNFESLDKEHQAFCRIQNLIKTRTKLGQHKLRRLRCTLCS